MAGGQSYTQIAGAGGSSDQARQAANKVAGINFLPNSLFGFTDLVPALRDNPFLTTLLLGGVTGASGQVAQNTVTGRPLTENVLASTLQGAGMMGAMHLGTSAFFGNLSQAMDAARESELRQRAPEMFEDATRAVIRGDLRFPVQEFNDYFAGKSLDPAAVAAELGAANYGDAMRDPDGEVVVPRASFFGRLAPEHQAGLMPSVIDPNSGRTFGQYEAGGPQRWLDGLSQTDPEMASSPEWQAVKEDLRQQYVDRGLPPENAEASATTAANIVSNFGRRVGMAPGEMLNAYSKLQGSNDAKTVELEISERSEGAAPPQNESSSLGGVSSEDGRQNLYRRAIESIRNVVQGARQPGDVLEWANFARVPDWLSEMAQKVGQNIKTWSHGVDTHGVRHAFDEHGNTKTEESRGQQGITEEDFEKIPQIIAAPDRVFFGIKSSRNLDTVGYIKKLDDGTIVYLEEQRRRRRRLSAHTLYKFRSGTDVDHVAHIIAHNFVQRFGGRVSWEHLAGTDVSSLPPNARNGGERTPILIIFHGPGERAMDVKDDPSISEPGIQGRMSPISPGSRDHERTGKADSSHHSDDQQY